MIPVTVSFERPISLRSDTHIAYPRNKRIALLASPTLFACLIASPSYGQLPAPPPKILRLHRYEPDYRFRFHADYRVEGQKPFALSLRGGSAKGLSHLGVLQGMDEECLGPDAIVGTSAGSLMGSLYGSGFSADGIARIFKSQDFGMAFDDRSREMGWSLSEDEIAHSTPYKLEFRDGKLDLIPGRTASRNVRAALLPMLGRASWLSEGDFDHLRVPLRIVATDLTAGCGKVFAGGSLVDSVMASMCLPGLFEPVEIQGHQYVDGGPFENLPIMTARKEFPDMVHVGVAIGRPWNSAPKNSLLKLLDASLDMAMAQTEIRSTAMADLIIRPEMGSASEFDFHRQVDALMKEGRKAFDAQRHVLESLVYGQQIDEIAASDLRLDATDVPGAGEWLQEMNLPRPVTFRGLYRTLRKAYRDLPISNAEVRLPTEPGAEATLVLLPSPIVTRLDMDLPPKWPPEARHALESRLANVYGIEQQRNFHEGAWNRAIEDLLVEAILAKVPILDVQGSGLRSDGVLCLRIREPYVEGIQSRDEALQEQLGQLFARLQRMPVRTDLLTQGLARAESRLGLSSVKPNLTQQDGNLVLDIDSTKAARIELSPHFAYESSWGPHVALDANLRNFLGTGSRFLFHGAVNDLQSNLQGQVLNISGHWPRLEFGLGVSETKHWFDDSLYVPVDKLVQRKFWVRTQARFGAEERGLLQFDVGQLRGFSRESGEDGPENQAGFGRLALEWDSFEAHTIPTAGLLIRSSFTRAFRSDSGPTFSEGYFRTRRLWRISQSDRLPGLDLDLEIAGNEGAPKERWYIFGGPDSFIGTPSASLLAPNFGIARVGFPFTLTTVFGVAVQTAPRIDFGRFVMDLHRPGESTHAMGAGLIFRAVIRSFYVELSGGTTRVKAETGKVSHTHHVGFLIGTRPYDLWKER